MNKELEALEEIKNHKIKLDANIKYDNGDETQYRFETIKDMFPKQFAIIETALKDHEKITGGDFHIEPINVHIENQKKLKEYESMKQNNIIVADKMISNEDLDKLMNQSRWQFRVIRPSLDEETQKKLKSLEIIKEKEADVFIFLHSGDLEAYNDIVEDNRKLTHEEYELLKEVLL